MCDHKPEEDDVDGGPDSGSRDLDEGKEDEAVAEDSDEVVPKSAEEAEPEEDEQ